MWGELVVLGAAAVGAGGATWAGRIAAAGDHREQARQARREAYTTIQNIAIDIERWAARTYPLISNSDDPAPDYPAEEERARAQVLVELHGTPAVRDAFDAFASVFKDFVNAANDIAFGESRKGQASKQIDEASHHARRALPDLRRNLRDTRLATAEAMRDDLYESPRHRRRSRRHLR